MVLAMNYMVQAMNGGSMSKETFDPTMSTVVLGQVLEERRQQVERWGYTPESDDADTAEREEGRRKRLDRAVKITFHQRTAYEKRRAEAVIAAAMMVACVEKLDRAEQRRIENLKLGVKT